MCELVKNELICVLFSRWNGIKCIIHSATGANLVSNCREHTALLVDISERCYTVNKKSPDILSTPNPSKKAVKQKSAQMCTLNLLFKRVAIHLYQIELDIL